MAALQAEMLGQQQALEGAQQRAGVRRTPQHLTEGQEARRQVAVHPDDEIGHAAAAAAAPTEDNINIGGQLEEKALQDKYSAHKNHDNDQFAKAGGKHSCTLKQGAALAPSSLAVSHNLVMDV